MSLFSVLKWQWLVLIGLLVALVGGLWTTTRSPGPPPLWVGTWLGPRLPDGSGSAMWAFGNDGSFVLEGLDGRLALTGTWSAGHEDTSLRLMMKLREQESSAGANAPNRMQSIPVNQDNPWPAGALTWQIMPETTGFTLQGDLGGIHLHRR